MRARLLATDYLNHFNEVVMLFDLIADMPECFEEAAAWQPKTYQEHFRDSGIADRELAITAYESAPADYREMFDQTVDRMNDLVATSLARIKTALQSGDAGSVRIATKCASRDLMRLTERASAIINGAMPTISQDEIDDFVLAYALHKFGASACDIQIDELMSENVISCASDTSIAKAVEIMLENEIRP